MLDSVDWNVIWESVDGNGRVPGNSKKNFQKVNK